MWRIHVHVWLNWEWLRKSTVNKICLDFPLVWISNKEKIVCGRYLQGVRGLHVANLALDPLAVLLGQLPSNVDQADNSLHAWLEDVNTQLLTATHYAPSTRVSLAANLTAPDTNGQIDHLYTWIGKFGPKAGISWRQIWPIWSVYERNKEKWLFPVYLSVAHGDLGAKERALFPRVGRVESDRVERLG